MAKSSAPVPAAAGAGSSSPASSPILWALAWFFGISYMYVVLGESEGFDVRSVVWKGLPVSLLSAWAYSRSRDRGISATAREARKQIALVMLLGSLGDVVLAVLGLEAGGVVFAIGHFFAIRLYYLHPGLQRSGQDKLRANLLLPAALCVAVYLVQEQPVVQAALATAYTCLVALMASSAMKSRFAAHLSGMGGLMFLISDLFIFAKEGPLKNSPLPLYLIWPLYFAGQALLTKGVVDEDFGEKKKQ